MVFLVLFWFTLCKTTICFPFFGTYLLFFWYDVSKSKLCYSRWSNYRVYRQYDLILSYPAMDNDVLCMRISFIYPEVCARTTFCGVLWTVTGN